MTDLVLRGPWPRKLHANEIKAIKDRAVTKILDAIDKSASEFVFGIGDKYVFQYTINCGTQAEMDKNSKSQCGAIPPEGGPVCKLDKGHSCEHSSVKRW